MFTRQQQMHSHYITIQAPESFVLTLLIQLGSRESFIVTRISIYYTHCIVMNHIIHKYKENIYLICTRWNGRLCRPTLLVEEENLNPVVWLHNCKPKFRVMCSFQQYLDNIELLQERGNSCRKYIYIYKTILRHFSST